MWDTPIADRTQGLLPTQPGRSSINGKVRHGLGGCDRYGNDGCCISAYDAATGKQLWKFNTIAQAGEARRRHVGQARRQPPRRRRDLDRRQLRSRISNLTYWGIAQAKPWMRASRGTIDLDNALYTSSTVALEPEHGKLAWHYQHAPGESLDLDEVFERVLVDIGDQKVVFTIGKAGILWKLDRKTGKYLGYKETVFQNVFERDRSEDRRAAVSRRHPRAADRPVDRSRARAPKAATTGRR